MRTRVASAILALVILLLVVAPALAAVKQPPRFYARAIRATECMTPAGDMVAVRRGTTIQVIGQSGYWLWTGQAWLCPVSEFTAPRPWR